MNRETIKQILHKQNASFNYDVHRKISELMSEEYQFTDISKYIQSTKYFQNQDSNESLADAFGSSFTMNSQTNNFSFSENSSYVDNTQTSSYAETNSESKQSIPQTAEQPNCNLDQEEIEKRYNILNERKKILAERIKALRGCQLPGSYLSK